MSIAHRHPAPRLVLISSQPPLHAQRRYLASGDEVTKEYAAACRSSWVEFCSSAMSVNSALERDLGIEDLGLPVNYVETDLVDQVEKPVVLLDDLLRHGGDADFLALINADTYLASAAAKRMLEQLTFDYFLAEHRMDVGDLESTSGTPYTYGFDFFVIPARHIEVLTGTRFAIGVPWWDHFVPVALILEGVTPIGSGLGLAFSLHHEERWDKRLWVLFGREYVSEIADRISVRHVTRRGFRRFLWTILTSAFALRVSQSGFVTDWALKRVSDANLRFVGSRRVHTSHP